MSNSEQETKFISLKDLAAGTGIGYWILYRMARVGELKAVRLHSKGAWKVYASELGRLKGVLNG